MDSQKAKQRRSRRKSRKGSQRLPEATQLTDDASTLAENINSASSDNYGGRDTDDGLCKPCRTLYRSKICNMKIIFSKDARKFGLYVAPLKHIKQDSSCKMCRFLFEMRYTTSGEYDYHLHAYSAMDYFFKFRWSHSDTPLVGVFPQATDTPLFGVFPQATDAFTSPSDLDRFGGGSLFTTCLIDFDGEEDPPEYEDPSMNQLTRDVEDHNLLTTNNQPTDNFQQRRRMEALELTEIAMDPDATGHLEDRENPNDFPGPTTRAQGLPRHDIFGRKLEEGNIDFSLLRGWTEWCSDICKHNLRRFKADTTLYLLDCCTREVKQPGKRTPYVALSYVWGPQTESVRPKVDSIPYKIPERCPATIEDAIEVVKRLGFKHLWVDMFCISSDPSRRHEQIANMDVIYMHAKLTIIAAAGSDVNYGLPGVGATKRKPQQRLRLGQDLFVSILPDPAGELSRSIYNTRGWTYQEQFFAYHQLIFTDSQVYFECPVRRRYYESVSFPVVDYKKIQRAGAKDNKILDNYLKLSPGTRVETAFGLSGLPQIPAKDYLRPVSVSLFEHHVNRYTSRKLTYECDSLNALRGVLDRFADEKDAIEHIYGVPFQTRAQSSWCDLYGLFFGLSWTHGPKTRASRRRPMFPSWSWAGWEGQVTWLVDKFSSSWIYPRPYEPTEFLFIDESTKMTIPIKSWRTRRGRLAASTLRLKMSFVFRSNPIDSSALGYDDGWYLETDDSVNSRLHVTIPESAGSKDQLETGQTYGFILCWYLDKDTAYMLIVSQRDSTKEDVWERIGIILVPFSWYKKQEKEKFLFVLA